MKRIVRKNQITFLSFSILMTKKDTSVLSSHIECQTKKYFDRNDQIDKKKCEKREEKNYMALSIKLK